MTSAATCASSGNAWGDRRFQYFLIAPAVFVLLGVGLFPFLYSVMVSFQNISLMEEDTSWAGFINYVRIFKDGRLWEAVLHTAIITAVSLPLELILGLVMAQQFVEDQPFKKVFIALLIIPSVITPIVAGSMWRLMFDDHYGPINQMIGWIAGEHITILWGIAPEFSYPAIIVCEVWEWTPFMFIILLAGLSNVDRDQTDAARIDGASSLQVFMKIALPAIWPVMIVALFIRGLDLVKIFDIVWQLTHGGPGTKTETMSIYFFIRGFQEFDTSYTGALVVVLVLLLSFLVMFALRRVEVSR